MDNPLSQAGAEAIKQVVEWVKAGGSMAAAEAPEIARQYLAYQTIKESVQAACAGMLFVSFAALCAYSIKREFYPKDGHEDDWAPGVVCGGMGSVFCFAITIMEALDVFKIIVAPKIVLIEGLTNLIR